MRILHTGDWHMNDHLGRLPRSADIVRSLERIGAYLESEDVDVMIVAGDLFCDKSSKEDLRTAVGEIERIFSPFLARGGSIVAISGNHDSEVFFHTLRDALRLAPAHPASQAGLAPGVEPPGRLYLYPRPAILKLADKSGTVIQFALMPYPTAAFLRLATAPDSNGEAASALLAARLPDEQNLSKQSLFTRYFKQKIAPALDETLQTVFVSHILISGVTTRAGYRLSIENDVAFAPNDVPTGFAYAAFGHIHAPQEASPNASHARYCGSVERLDLGEKDDEKSVVIVDIGPRGRIGEPRCLPMPDVSPFLDLTLGSKDGSDPEPEIATLEAQWAGKPESERTRYLVRCRLYYRYGTDRLHDLRRRLDALFPRIYQTDQIAVRIGEDGKVEPPAEQIDMANVRGNALAYIDKKLAENAPNKAAVIKALESLLGEDTVIEGDGTDVLPVLSPLIATFLAESSEEAAA